MNGSRPGKLTLGSLQILVGGLMAGVVGLLVVAVVVSPPARASFDLTEEKTVWLGVVAAAVVGAAVLVVVLSRLLAARAAANAGQSGRGDAEQLADYASLIVVQCAVIDAVGLIGATVYLVVDLGLGLILTLASLVALLLLFPTAARHRDFADRVTRPE